MTRRGSNPGAAPTATIGRTSYEIRIRGRLSDSIIDSLGLDASVEPVETVLHGPVTDQAALHGLLDRIQALGLELVELRRLPPPSHSS